jgi:hypothetical protein
MNTYESTVMYKCECKEFMDEVESIKYEVANTVKITTLKAIDAEKQLKCPPFKIYLSGDDRELDKSCEILCDICVEKGWKARRTGHRDIEVDPNPEFLVRK